MQTNFSAQQLSDPRIAEAERILRRCVHCGFCTAVCSTYVVLGDERDSPRGRIYLIKDMLEQNRDAGAQVQHHIDRCLSCLSCMTTCPSGVDYMHLVDMARVHINETGTRTPKDRAMRWLLSRVIPYPDRFRLALKLVPLGRPFVNVMRKLGLKELASMIELAPQSIPPAPRYEGPGTAATDAKRRARVIMMAGCAQQVLRPDINDATIRLLARRGVDVVVANGAGCCGSLVHHMGQEEQALEQARRNVDAWLHEMEKAPVDAIIINASGCGTTVKDYGHMLRHDPEYAEKAKRISEMTRDITEFLSGYELGPPKRYSSLRVAYHSACSMQHGQRITDEPKELLVKAGYTVTDIAEGHICCGSAGVYNILQPEIAGQLRERKVKNIRNAKPDLVATGNIGCISQLEKGMDIPIAHTVELLDWAFGGPVPRGLEGLAKFVSDVPEPPRYVPDDYLEADAQ
ncbi:glycolate oxidase iron-sulfur subunit [Candidatus Filomicrobium marinum]|uniref:Glycolate oxidase iron-sulfur subunit n=2 Tax=Filomicrobium TaxID=119044 RepID=A0A0D6JA17_9HYPH|nr:MULTISPECIES: glycolate oxidase subunit GlcF [Filomicrobium]MCV0368737.1 glycolate oxidase subunit GlcF [Filomicrobium sp.]CFW99325.1 glycolate oxidase iron-sulfur subunit [Candidatus Filomicrobium marinum]CPR15036.1 glycolate oxidase iron-sulfur subunit [Candidatus Filomicrobium marinum]SDO71565.1 glycolate oxidase iron-sulfur subunit [Filomicrobium insigne]